MFCLYTPGGGGYGKEEEANNRPQTKRRRLNETFSERGSIFEYRMAQEGVWKEVRKGGRVKTVLSLYCKIFARHILSKKDFKPTCRLSEFQIFTWTPLKEIVFFLFFLQCPCLKDAAHVARYTDRLCLHLQGSWLNTNNSGWVCPHQTKYGIKRTFVTDIQLLYVAYPSLCSYTESTQ